MGLEESNWEGLRLEAGRKGRGDLRLIPVKGFFGGHLPELWLKASQGNVILNLKG